jgi:ABC-type branched-subunit amino acid transport system ATPase component
MSARRIADHMCILWKGKLVADGPADELTDHARRR